MFFEREVRARLSDQRHRVFDHGQRFQPQKIHFQQPEVVQRIHRILADDVVAFDVAAERDVFGKIAITDDNAGRVHAGIARKSFQRRSRIPSTALSAVRSRLLVFNSGFFSTAEFESNVQFVRNHFRDPVSRRRSSVPSPGRHRAPRSSLSACQK